MITFVKNFFIENINDYKWSNIENVEEIKIGFSNNIFCLKTTDNNFFFIRIIKENNFINRSNEKIYFLKSLKKPLFIDEKGNMINNWIDDFIILDKPNKKEIDLIIKNILLISKIEITDLNTFDYFKYFNNTKRIDNKYIQKYRKIIKKYELEKMVFAHNDLNLSNIYLHEEIIEFIDWEWCSLNNNYWDITYFLKDLILDNKFLLFISKKYTLSINKIYDFLFLTTLYAISWIEFYKIKNISNYYKHLKMNLKFLSMNI